MRKHIRNWVLVADSARAHLFVPNEDETDLTARELVGIPTAEASHFSRELASDRPGRSNSSAGGGVRHAIEPHHDYHKQEKHNFVVQLADAVNRAFQAKDFDRLVLVVPPRTLGELRKCLSAPVQACMEVVAKDLTKASIPTIWSDVAQIVRHRPVIPAP